MTLPRRILRTVRPVTETLLAGLLVGVVATALVTQLVVTNATGTTAEVPQARAYMIALISNDLDAMSKLGPTGDAVGQAITFQKRADALKDVKIGSLTYLGGSSVGSVGVHLYVVEATDANGVHLVPFSVTVLQGRVIYIA